MRLVFDIQSLQSASRLRGIGRYTQSLIAAIDQHGHSHEVILLLNGSIGASQDPLISELGTLLPAVECVVCHLPGPSAAYDSRNITRQAAAELIREAFISELQPDLVHVFSVMEGYEDNVVTSLARLGADYPVTATFYDLIPLLNPQEYLGANRAFKRHYSARIDNLKRADGLLAISNFSAGEAAEHLCFPQEKISVAALGPLGPNIPEDDACCTDIEALKGLGVAPEFLLYVGGSDPRKNLPRLVEAWSLLPPDLQREHQLVMAGSMPKQDVATLKNIVKAKSAHPHALVFTGQVSDQQLALLYRQCSAFVFPSWHEGFGLPALEAMAVGAPVIAANASSLPEVVGLDEALFDPLNVGEISAKLQNVLTDTAFRQRLRAHAPHQAAKFSWQETANRALAFFEATIDRSEQPRSNQTPKIREQDWYADYPDRLQCLLTSLATEMKTEPHREARRQLMCQVAAAIDRNERQILQRRLRGGSDISPWLIEGPFDSSYSLALLNRELARGLRAANIDVRLHSTEGPGDFDPDPDFLALNPDIAAMVVSNDEVAQPCAVNSRLLYPPRVDDMPHDFGMLHLYGWEEGELPAGWVKHFNQHLRGITTMSSYVSKVLIDNGVTVPIAVAGVGVDHWERTTPCPRYQPPQAAGFTFLHVSSCFPRKGADVLLRAWGSAFKQEDDVTLIIKTFRNPHNTINQLLESARQDFSQYPRVVVIEDDLKDAELKSLMLSCDALVAPSRGEGFGLPIAEAMLSGLPVIATRFGGHMDFCNDQNSWLVDFSFARARTHFELPDSVWAEPCPHDLAFQLRAVREAPLTERKKRAALGRERLLNDMTWKSVAHRVATSAKSWRTESKESSGPSRVGWVSSWNTRCGIASYSAHLLEHIKSNVSVYASHLTEQEKLDKWLLPADGPEVTRCWSAGFGDDLTELSLAILADLPDIVVIQFNYGFYEFPAFSALILELKAANVKIVLMLHATVDPPELPDRSLMAVRDALACCDRLLVHNVEDLNRLKELGLHNNTALIPHGVMAADRAVTLSALPAGEKSRDEPFRLASFGFLLPHKGLEQLLEATAMLLEEGRAVTLNMLNAEYPAEASREAIEEVSKFIAASGIENAVSLDTTFYSDEECLSRLAGADLIIFPYQSTSESSSAAVRHGIASGAPVAVTPVPIFEDVASAVIELPGTTPAALAEGIIEVMSWQTSQWTEHKKNSADWMTSHSHAAIGSKLSDMLSTLSGLT